MPAEEERSSILGDGAPSVMSSTSPLSPKHWAKRQPPDASGSMMLWVGLEWGSGLDELIGRRVCQPDVVVKREKGKHRLFVVG